MMISPFKLSFILLLLLSPSVPLAQSFFTPTLDGDLSDWAGQFQYVDHNEAATPDGRDIQNVYVANDATNLCFAVDTYAALNATAVWVSLDLNNNGIYENGIDRAAVFQINPATYACVGTLTGIWNVRGDPDPLNNAPWWVTNNTGVLGCGSVAASANGLEGCTTLASLGLPSNPSINITAIVYSSGGLWDIAPGGSPEQDGVVGVTSGYPGPVDGYDNTSAAVPTAIKLRYFEVRHMPHASHLEWESSISYHSAGLYIQRLDEENFKNIAGPFVPNAKLKGSHHTYVDNTGGAQQHYRLMERDVFGRESIFLPRPKPNIKAHQLRFPVHSAAKLEQALVLNSTDQATGKLVIEARQEGLNVVCEDTLALAGLNSNDSLHATFLGQRVSLYRNSSDFMGCDGISFLAPELRLDTHHESVLIELSPSAPVLQTIQITSGETFAPNAASTTIEGRIHSLKGTFIDMASEGPTYFSAFANPSIQPKVVLADSNQGRSVSISVHARPLALQGDIEGQLTLRSGSQTASFSLQHGWQKLNVQNFVLGDAEIVFDAALSAQSVAGALLADLRIEGLSPQNTNAPDSLAYDIPQSGMARWPYATQELVILARNSNGEIRSIKGRHGHDEYLEAEFLQGERAEVFSYDDLVFPQGRPQLENAAFGPDFEGAQYVIVAPQTMRAVADTLATHRESDGLNSVVLSWDVIHDYFGNSQPTYDSLQAFMSHAHNNWSIPPQYLLLVGQGHSDAKQRSGHLHNAEAVWSQSFNPKLMYQEYGDALPGVAVGRIPVNDIQSFATYVEKIIAYEQKEIPNNINATLLYGEETPGDGRFDLIAEFIGNAASTILGRQRISPAEIDTLALAQAWSQSSFIVYAGHGDPAALDTGLSKTILKQQLSPREPVLLSTSCNGAMAFQSDETLAWDLVSSPSGSGTIAYIGSSSLTDPNVAAGLLSQVVLGSQNKRLGDALQDAHQKSPNILSTGMVLVGDPALRIANVPSKTTQENFDFFIEQSAQIDKEKDPPKQSGCTSTTMNSLSVLVLFALLRRRRQPQH